ncbi:unnamed protein product [Coffea canephora]|uniref:Uncharacterized protein n=1 Tax=Coffea canephora TaxID=49390 RepID=A0A068U9S5_COFCA|nr:unnamed protein product [Coffea canephora]
MFKLKLKLKYQTFDLMESREKIGIGGIGYLCSD